LLYQLGRRWSETDSVDPAIGIRETETIVHANSEEAYRAAVAAGPGSRGAGYAAWELISFDRPYEVEGNYEPEADRWLTAYGSFLRTYPGHSLAGEAMFMVARAKWIKAGYPELFGYFQEGQNRREVSQFLDTWGFGGPVPRVDRRPQDTKEPLRIFREIVRRYPRTNSAAAAQYYVAVILDWCLNNPAQALPEYEKFVALYPASDNVTIAQRRLETLRKGK
jgi:tetratricopeptide (TPR) repeat protein